MDCVITGEYYCKCDRQRNNQGLIVTQQGTMRKLWTDHAVYIKFIIDNIIDSIIDCAKDNSVNIQYCTNEINIITSSDDRNIHNCCSDNSCSDNICSDNDDDIDNDLRDISNNNFNAIMRRLIHNQEDICIEISKYVNINTHGNKLSSLLVAHIRYVVEVAKQVRYGTEIDTRLAVNNLLNNGDQVADNIISLMSKHHTTNDDDDSNCDHDIYAFRSEFRTHCLYIVEIAILRNNNLHTKEYKKFDAHCNHTLLLADVIYSGITTSCDSTPCS